MTPFDALLLGLVAFSSAAYLLMLGAYAVGLRRGRLRDAQNAARAPWTPSVTLLKPLAGCEDELAANLESFATLRWDDLEILFGVASPSDPARHVVERFLAAYPELDARIVQTDAHAAINPKVAQLLTLSAAARGEVLIVSDANVRVRPDYVREIVATLGKPGVHLVTSILAGTGERTVGGALENLVLATHAAPGVVAGYVLTGRAISIGKSMAMRAADLARVGGFESVSSVLAEDHVLAQRFTAHGLGVDVCMCPVENRNVDCGVRRTFERHARWAKMRRAITPHGFVFEPLLMPVLIASIAVVLSPSRATALALLASVALQLVGSSLLVSSLRPSLALRHAPLEIARVYVLFLCWLLACVSRRVSWRGRVFEVRAGSRLVPARPRLIERGLGRIFARLRA